MKDRLIDIRSLGLAAIAWIGTGSTKLPNPTYEQLKPVLDPDKISVYDPNIRSGKIFNSELFGNPDKVDIRHVPPGNPEYDGPKDRYLLTHYAQDGVPGDETFTQCMPEPAVDSHVREHNKPQDSKGDKCGEEPTSTSEPTATSQDILTPPPPKTETPRPTVTGTEVSTVTVTSRPTEKPTGTVETTPTATKPDTTAISPTGTPRDVTPSAQPTAIWTLQPTNVGPTPGVLPISGSAPITPTPEKKSADDNNGIILGAGVATIVGGSIAAGIKALKTQTARRKK